MATDSENVDADDHYRKLFVGSLTPETTEENLKEFYSQYGTVTECVLKLDRETEKSRGFGFVTFSSAEEADNAMKNRPHEINGKTVDPKRAVPREQSGNAQANINTKRLYVSGVNEDHTEDHFKSYFSKFGNIEKVDIVVDKNTGQRRGFAFVVFDDYDSVGRCILDKFHTINGVSCGVKKGLTRDEMLKVQQMNFDRMQRGLRSRGGRGNLAYQGGRGNYLNTSNFFGGTGPAWQGMTGQPLRGGNSFGVNGPAWRGNRNEPPAGNFREPHGQQPSPANWYPGVGPWPSVAPWTGYDPMANFYSAPPRSQDSPDQ